MRTFYNFLCLVLLIDNKRGEQWTRRRRIMTRRHVGSHKTLKYFLFEFHNQTFRSEFTREFINIIGNMSWKFFISTCEIPCKVSWDIEVIDNLRVEGNFVSIFSCFYLLRYRLSFDYDAAIKIHGSRRIVVHTKFSSSNYRTSFDAFQFCARFNSWCDTGETRASSKPRKIIKIVLISMWCDTIKVSKSHFFLRSKWEWLLKFNSSLQV